MKKAPAEGLPTYRLLTGPDDAAFCRRVSEALALGYELYGSPAATFDGERVIVAHARQREAPATAVRLHRLQAAARGDRGGS
jgi:hypothetical protein